MRQPAGGRGLRRRWGRHALVARLQDRRRSGRGSRRVGGASSIELAVVAPALLLIIFFSIQAGLYYYGRVAAQQAAREGVSLLRLSQDDSANAEVKQSVEDYARAIARESLLDPVATPEYGIEGGERVRVTVTGKVITLVPGLDLTVTQAVEGTVERFERDDRPR